MYISEDIRYVGVNDYQIDLFEGQYPVDHGMSYNSYVIIDEKIAVTDTVADGFGDMWLENIKAELGDRTPDYLIVHHMEPDHSANIPTFMEAFPKATIVATAKAFTLMKQFYGSDYPDRQQVVKEGDELDLGKHSLAFVTAPMVHWPEVVMSYDKADKVLFSADAFGKFGAIGEDEDDWVCEARRYYCGIVGKFGRSVQSVLKKAGALDIQTICPLHGPVLSENLPYYLDLYNTWSSYDVETEGIVIAYCSIYGHTAEAARLLGTKLEERGCTVVMIDLARDDTSTALEDAFRYSTLVLASPTYQNGIFPFMHDFLTRLVEHNFSNRRVAFIENGSWAPQAAKVMKAELEPAKNITYAENKVTILSALNDESRAQIDALVDELTR